MRGSILRKTPGEAAPSGSSCTSVDGQSRSLHREQGSGRDRPAVLGAAARGSREPAGTEGPEAPDARSPRDSVPASEQKRSAGARPAPARGRPGSRCPPPAGDPRRRARCSRVPTATLTDRRSIKAVYERRSGQPPGPQSLSQLRSAFRGGSSCKTRAPEQLGPAPSVGGSCKARAAAVLVPPEYVPHWPARLSSGLRRGLQTTFTYRWKKLLAQWFSAFKVHWNYLEVLLKRD